MPTDPQLEALTRLGRGSALLLAHDDRDGARTELEAALVLAHRHRFDHLAMQCLVLLGVIAGASGDLRTMRTVSTQALAAVSTHDWESSTWSAAASAMLAYTALLRGETHQAEHLAAQGLALGPVLSPPPLRFALRTVHGAATFDRGDRTGGLAELQQARAEIGDLRLGAEQAASAALLEFRAALLLGHATAARTAQGWLTERTHNNAELLIMRAWTEAGGGRPEPARAILHPILNRSVPALLPHTLVESFLLETALATAADERPAARRALQAALAAAEPLDALRPVHPGRTQRPRPARRAARQLRPNRHLRTTSAGRGCRWRPATDHAERAGTHRARTAALAALVGRDRHRPDRVGQHHQKPRPVHLHQTRRQQPPNGRPVRPRTRPARSQRVMKSYGRAPTFLALTGYEQVRSVAAAIAGDREAAERVELVLPETGVCGGAGLFEPVQAQRGRCCVDADLTRRAESRQQRRRRVNGWL